MRHNKRRSRPGVLNQGIKTPAVGNEKSGQASASSTTTTVDDYHNNNDDGGANNADELNNNRIQDARNPVENDIANINISSSDEDSNELFSNLSVADSEAEIRRPQNFGSTNETDNILAAHSRIGGGDGSQNNERNRSRNNLQASSFTDFLVHFLIACVIALILILVANIVEGIFKHPGNRRPPGHIYKRKTYRYKP